jgi:hypothetical protein
MISDTIDQQHDSCKSLETTKDTMDIDPSIPNDGNTEQNRGDSFSWPQIIINNLNKVNNIIIIYNVYNRILIILCYMLYLSI